MLNKIKVETVRSRELLRVFDATDTLESLMEEKYRPGIVHRFSKYDVLDFKFFATRGVLWEGRNPRCTSETIWPQLC